MAVRGRPFQKGNPGGPGRPKGPTARDAFRASLSKLWKETDKTRLEQWCEDFANETDLRLRLDLLKWLEGASPQESQPASTAETSQKVAEFLHGQEKKTKAKRQARKPGKRLPDQGGETPGV